MRKLRNLATLKKKSFTHLVTAASCLPSAHLATLHRPFGHLCQAIFSSVFPTDLFNHISSARFLLNLHEIYNKSKSTLSERWPNARKGDRRLLWASAWKTFFWSGQNLQFTHDLFQFYQAFATKKFVGWENEPQSWNPCFLGVRSPVWLFQSGGDPVYWIVCQPLHWIVC